MGWIKKLWPFRLQCATPEKEKVFLLKASTPIREEP